MLGQLGQGGRQLRGGSDGERNDSPSRRYTEQNLIVSREQPGQGNSAPEAAGLGPGTDKVVPGMVRLARIVLAPEEGLFIQLTLLSWRRTQRRL